MAEGVAEIEQRPVPVLALVAHHHGGLGPAALRHRVVALGAAGENPAPVPLAPAEERLVVDEPVFRDLGIAGAHLAERQGVEERRVGEHQARLMEGADEVLAVGGVDARLAADRRIDLGEQRRRHLHEAHPAPDDRRREAREVAHDPPAQRHHEIAALDPRAQDRVADFGQAGIALRGLAWGHGDHRRAQALGLERTGQRLPVKPAHGSIGHDGGRAGAERRDAWACFSEEPAAHMDLVGPVPEGHRHHEGGGGRPMHGGRGTHRAAPEPSSCGRTGVVPVELIAPLRRARRARPRDP
jgi:hypothetical protein